MRNINEDSITQAVIAVMSDSRHPRLLTVMTSLVQHLHAFAREVKLTEAEWEQAIGFLTEVGHLTDDKRQEFILLSDTLGLSTLVTAQNHAKPAACTESTVFGPFYVPDPPGFALGADIANGASGEPCFVHGQVRAPDGRAIAGARMDVWQADEDGHYDVQLPAAPGESAHRARARLHSDAEGRFHFRTVLPVPYPIPHDGPVGRMLEALGRHPWRPAHLHFMIVAPGYERLITHLFREGGDYLDSDAVFGVRSTLVSDWVRHEPGRTPDGGHCESPYHEIQYDFILHPVA